MFVRCTQALGRMLLVYAKLNPGVAYVQGMNELLAPLFYVMGNTRGVDLGRYKGAYC